MKKIIAVLILSLFVACSADISSEGTKVVTFDTSLKCIDCEAKLFDALPKEAGVLDLEVSFEQKMVKIVFDSTETTVDKLAEKLNEMGYSAFVKDLKSN